MDVIASVSMRAIRSIEGSYFVGLMRTGTFGIVNDCEAVKIGCVRLKMVNVIGEFCF